MKKRIVSAVLVLALAVSLLGATASALGDPFNTISAGGGRYLVTVTVYDPAIPVPDPTNPAHILSQKLEYRTDGAHSAGIRSDGSLWTWGMNRFGQLGNGRSGPTEQSLAPTKIMDGMASVSVGRDHTAAVSLDGKLYVWGRNTSAQLGIGNTTNRDKPVELMTGVRAVSAGSEHTVALKTNGELWAWGNNQFGQVGVNSHGSFYVSKPEKVLSDVIFAEAGAESTYAITKNGDLYVWGNNEFAQLGTGDKFVRTSPTKIMSKMKSVSAGYEHALAVAADGTLYAWGMNLYGQLGNGERFFGQGSVIPVEIMKNIASASAGSYHSTAITTKGELWSWGYNAYGQLGDGKTANQVVPILVMSDVASVSAGDEYTMALTSDGQIWTWGYNIDGRLGDGTYGNIKGVTGPQPISTSWKIFGFEGNAISPWAKTATDWALGRSTIAPWAKDHWQQGVSRGEFAAAVVSMVEQATGKTLPTASSSTFSDTKDVSVLKAYSVGIVTGITDKTFHPNGALNREQLAAMLYRAVRYIEKQNGVSILPKSASLLRFDDHARVSDFAVEAMSALAANSIMVGDSARTISPKRSATIEQAIVLVHRVLEASKQ